MPRTIKSGAGRALAVAALAAASIIGLTSTADAHDPHWRHHHRGYCWNHPCYVSEPVFVRQPVYVAPVYAPPVYYVPPPSGVNFNLTLPLR